METRLQSILSDRGCSAADLAGRVRKRILDLSLTAGNGHASSCLSIVETLIALYSIADPYLPEANKDDGRLRLILSKGHSALSQYVLFSELGIISDEELRAYNSYGSPLSIHPQRNLPQGIEATTGALGHGLAFAAGLALGLKEKRKNDRVAVILGDGECQEGSIWEAALVAAKRKLTNLTVILDLNGIQSLGYTKDIAPFDDIGAVWHGFGWEVQTVDGHNVDALKAAIIAPSTEEQRPRIIIAHTIKGKGFPMMEGRPEWHFRLLQPSDLNSTPSKEGSEL